MNNLETSKAIGVFDSGIGGLTVLRELICECPNEDFIYIGDDANSPYGEKSADQIQQLSLDVIRKQEFSDIKALVIACNTITAAAYDVIVQNSNVPVIGVVESGVNAALESTKNNKIGILATTATVKAGVYDKALKAGNTDVAITSVAAPKLHQLAENHLDKILVDPSEDVYKLVEEHIQAFIDAGCDTIILACTHFPPYSKIISSIVGDQVNLVDPSQNTAKSLARLLAEKGISNEGEGSYKIISTAGSDDKYKEFSKLILG